MRGDEIDHHHNRAETKVNLESLPYSFSHKLGTRGFPGCRASVTRSWGKLAVPTAIRRVLRRPSQQVEVPVTVSSQGTHSSIRTFLLTKPAECSHKSPRRKQQEESEGANSRTETLRDG